MNEQKRFELLNPRDLHNMTFEELYRYIDLLHSKLMDYQIVLDVAKDKNSEIRFKKQ